MRRRFLLIGSGLVLIGATVAFAYHTIQAPAVGTVTKSAVKPVRAVTEQLATYDDTFISYRYPTAFSSQTAPDSIAPVIARQWYARGSLTGWQLSVTVYRLETSQLRDNGDYNLRVSQPGRFTAAKTSTGDGLPATIFTDTSTESFDKVAFIQSGSTAAAVSVKGAAGKDDMELTTVLAGIVDSWHFK